jgi:hypothetical protein
LTCSYTWRSSRLRLLVVSFRTHRKPSYSLGWRGFSPTVTCAAPLYFLYLT